MIRVLALLACVFTVCITASSAFIRHAQNGVGCDGWPACYRAVKPERRAAAGAAAAEAPGVQIARALHRLSAMLVGALVLLIVVMGWSSMTTSGRTAAAVALAVTLFLAGLGRYTASGLPLVTLGNVIGGLLLAAVLGWIAAAGGGRGVAGTRVLALIALSLVALLAWDGTMIGTRHAIDACATALCAGGAHFDPAALDPSRGAVALTDATARGLHIAHRFVGFAFAIAVALLVLRLRKMRTALAAVLILLVVTQVLSGLGTTLGIRPLAMATLHNAVTALLAALLGAVAGAGVTTVPSAQGRR